MNQEAVDRLNKFAKDNFKGPYKTPIILEEEIRKTKTMKTVCPKCNSTNVAIEKRPDGNSKCMDCNHEDLSSKFPMGEYKVNVPVLQDEIDKYCDEMKITGTGFFYKNASALCASILPSQIKPWQDENKKLKLLIDVIEKKMGEDFVNQALNYIEAGDDTIETEEGILILSFQETTEKCCDEDTSNAGQGSLQ